MTIFWLKECEKQWRNWKSGNLFYFWWQSKQKKFCVKKIVKNGRKIIFKINLFLCFEFFVGYFFGFGGSFCFFCGRWGGAVIEFHFFQVLLFWRILINYPFWIILSDDASPSFLLFLACFPWFVDKFRIIIFKARKKVFYKLSLRIIFLCKVYRRIDLPILTEKSTCTQPHPISIIQSIIGIYQIIIKNFGSFRPTNKDITKKLYFVIIK